MTKFSFDFHEFLRRGQAVKRLLMLLFVLLFILIFVPFKTAILLAVIFAFGLSPATDWLSHGMNVRKNVAVWIGILVVIATFATLFGISAFRIYDLVLGEEQETTTQLGQQYVEMATTSFQELISRMSPFLKQFGLRPALLKQSGTQLVENGGRIIFKTLGQVITNVPEFFLQFFVFSSFLILLLLKGPGLRWYLRHFKFTTRNELDEVIAIFESAGRNMVMTNFLVGTVQATITVIGALCVGITEWAVIFTITFITSFIPVIGAGPISFIISGFLLLSDHWGKAVVMLCFGIVASTLDNLMRPMLISKTGGSLPPLVALIGLLGAIAMFGLPGLFFGPFIMDVCTQLTYRFVSQADEPTERTSEL